MAKYKDAVTWIALNDETGEDEGREALEGYLTVALVADVFGKSTETVARDVWWYRHRRRQQGVPVFLKE